MNDRLAALAQSLRGAPEATATLLSGMAAQPVAGLLGASQGVASLVGGKGRDQALADATDRISRVQDALTYQPRTQAGQRSLADVGRLMEPVAKVLEYIPDKAGESSPVTGAALAGLGAVVDPTKGVGKLGKIARMSAAEARAAGWWHPIGVDKKLSMPISAMTSESRPGGLPLLPEKIINPDEIPLGTHIIPAPGDRSDAGRVITSIGGRPLADPVVLEGGQKHQRTRGGQSAWASNPGEITKLMNKQAAAEAAGSTNTLLAPIAMLHGSMDFNTMMSDALIEQIRAMELKPSIIKQFDEAIRTGTAANPGRSEWLGLLHPEARHQLDKTGALRQAFVDRMQLDEFAKHFPDIAQTRLAITDPALLDVPEYAGGLSFSKLRQGAPRITDPEIPHSTYPHQMAADEYVGGFGVPVPREQMFSDFHQQRRLAGKDPRGDRRSFQLAEKNTQVVTPEWQDRMSALVEQLRKQKAESGQ